MYCSVSVCSEQCVLFSVQAAGRSSKISMQDTMGFVQFAVLAFIVFSAVHSEACSVH